jgi:DNA polymerase-3 subunit gamma/tau
LDAASNNSVEDIRSLIDQVRIPPQIGKYSVYIIDEVHMLSQGAFNALLKTLEEPPSYAIFILATTEKHKVPATILSRCQVYDFQRITIADIIYQLQYVANKEGIAVEEESLNVVAQKADGGMRDALSIFDQLVSFCGKKITYQQTIEILNVLDSEYYFKIMSYALSGNVTDALLLFDEVLQKGFDALHFVVGLMQHLRDVLVCKDARSAILLETSDVVRKQYVACAQTCSPQWLFQALDLANTCDVQYRTAKNKRLTVELFLVKLCRLTQTMEQRMAAASVAQQVPVRNGSSEAPKSDEQKKNTEVTNVTPVQSSAPQAVVNPTSSLNAGAASAKESVGAIRKMPRISEMGMKINKTVEEPEEAKATVVQDKNESFVAKDVEQTWEKICANYESDERLKAILSSSVPTLLPNGEIEIKFSNELQKVEFKSIEEHVLSSLRLHLRNEQIRLNILVEENNGGQKAFTNAEKYEQMLAEYPDLKVFTQSLGLLIE